jgi:uncharacterized protein YdeI (YjbR/CyaY-like superfamily)
MNEPSQLPVLSFSTSHAWHAWLEEHHADSSGVWLQFFKKASGVPTITYDQALDEALCYGWIDSQLKSFDEKSYLQKFSARRSKSIWSKRNREHIARLIQEGRMQPAGLAQVEEAKKDGRWDEAYDSPGNMEIPEDFQQELAKNKKAKEFFETLNKANVYAIAWRLQTAKKLETRSRRMQQILLMLEKNEKFH